MGSEATERHARRGPYLQRCTDGRVPPWPGWPRAALALQPCRLVGATLPRFCLQWRIRCMPCCIGPDHRRLGHRPCPMGSAWSQRPRSAASAARACCSPSASRCAPFPAATVLARLPRVAPPPSIPAFSTAAPRPLPASRAAAVWRRPMLMAVREVLFPHELPLGRLPAEWPLYTLEEFSFLSRLVRAWRGAAPPSRSLRDLLARGTSACQERGTAAMPIAVRYDHQSRSRWSISQLSSSEEQKNLRADAVRRRGFAPSLARRAAGAGHVSAQRARPLRPCPITLALRANPLALMGCLPALAPPSALAVGALLRRASTASSRPCGIPRVLALRAPPPTSTPSRPSSTSTAWS